MASGKAAAAVAACMLLVAAVGCGESEGVAENAIVTTYVDAPLCAEAKRQLERDGGRAGDVRVRAICVPAATEAKKLNLARLGANARQATEDSTSVGYIETFNPAANRFTEPILESAGIARIYRSSGKIAMARLLQAIETANSDSPRESVREALHQT